MSTILPRDPRDHGPINAAGDGQVLGEDRAKQGRRGMRMLLVLTVSTALALAAVFAIWAFNFRPLAHAQASGGAVASSHRATPTAS